MNDWIKALGFIQQLLITIITFYWAYQLVISLSGFIKMKEKPRKTDKMHKFMVIMPAHNEEAVIGHLVDSLKKVDYPKDLIDLFVIADNCTDNTKEVAKEAGAIVFERNDPDKKTKGYAMDWFLTKKKDELDNYDAFVVFDADNIVDANFFNVMNEKLRQGENLVQGYRDIKNPTDSWISGGYAIFYWSMNRFYHLARYNIGLSPLVNGTAFMVRMNLVKDKGWKTHTLTEDIEFSIQNIIKGQKLGWAKDAIVYDEQPTSFKQSWTQRERWTVGHIQTMSSYSGDLVRATVKNKKLMNFDAVLYIFGIPILILTLFLLVINTGLYIIGEIGGKELIINYLRYIIPTFLLPILMAYGTVKIEKKPVKPMMKAILLFPIFMGSWVVINIKSLIKPNKKWEKIEHNKSVGIDDKHIYLGKETDNKETK